MMKQSKKTGKLLACLLTLALSCAAAGCGNGNDGKGQEASAAPEADSQAPESIGAEADVDTQLDTEPEAVPEEPLQSITDLMISYVDGEESTISPTVMNYSEESVEASLQGFLLDGVAVEDWHVSERAPLETYNPDSVSFPLDPRTGRNLPIVLNANIYDYSEITVQASVSFSDGRDPLPLSATFQISELERPEDREPIQYHGHMLHVEEQELLKEDGVAAILPEQDEKYSAYMELELHFESSFEHTMYISFLDVTVNGEVVAKGSRTNFDGELIPGESNLSLYLGDCIDSDMASGEISFVLLIAEDPFSSIAEPLITIPYTMTEE